MVYSNVVYNSKRKIKQTKNKDNNNKAPYKEPV